LLIERLAEVSGAMSLPCQQYKIPGKHDTRHQCRQHSTPKLGPPHKIRKKSRVSDFKVFPTLIDGIGQKDVDDGGIFNVLISVLFTGQNEHELLIAMYILKNS